MATFSKIPLSRSIGGRSIIVSLSSSPGIVIHDTLTNANDIDEIYLYASNNTAYDSNLTLFWGTSAQANNILTINIESYAGLIVVIPGLILRGTGSESSSIYTYTTYPSAVNITGYINRITA